MAPPAEAGAETCPRCAEPLAAADQKGIGFAGCPRCKGTLLAQVDLARLLELLSGPLLQNFDPDATLDAAKPTDGRIACPRCRRPMAEDDYCQAGLVVFDRCEPCQLLWLDPGEIGAMTLMWARMQRRWERTHTQTMALQSELDDFVINFLYAVAMDF